MLPNETTLEDEYLINTHNQLKLLKNILMQVLRKPIYTHTILQIQIVQD